VVDVVDGNDVDDVSNVAPVVGTTVSDVVNASADFATKMQPRCNY